MYPSLSNLNIKDNKINANLLSKKTDTLFNQEDSVLFLMEGQNNLLMVSSVISKQVS